jgi:hypothetical protein
MCRSSSSMRPPSSPCSPFLQSEISFCKSGRAITRLPWQRYPGRMPSGFYEQFQVGEALLSYRVGLGTTAQRHGQPLGQGPYATTAQYAWEQNGIWHGVVPGNDLCLCLVGVCFRLTFSRTFAQSVFTTRYALLPASTIILMLVIV